MYIISILVLILSVVHAKKEFKFDNCNGKSIIQISNAEDTHDPVGPITPHLTVKATFTSTKDIEDAKDQYDVDITLSLKLWAVFGWLPAPSFVYNMIGRSIENKELSYLGNGVFRAHCLFKRLFGQCMPPKGTHVKEVDFSYLMNAALKPVKKIMPHLGWYRVHVNGETNDNQPAFCFDFEVSTTIGHFYLIDCLPSIHQLPTSLNRLWVNKNPSYRLIYYYIMEDVCKKTEPIEREVDRNHCVALNCLQFGSAEQEDAIVQISQLEDTRNPDGPITPDLTVKGTFKTIRDVQGEDAKYVDIALSAKMWAFLAWVPAPGFVYDKIGKSLENEELTYLGNGVFRAHCLFKRLFGQCMPPKGTHVKEVDFSYMMAAALKPVIKFMPSSAWYKVDLSGKTKAGDTVFCINFQSKLKVK